MDVVEKNVNVWSGLRKMSKYNVGKKNPMYGHHLSNEARKLISERLKGKRRSEQSKQLMSAVWHKTHVIRHAEKNAAWKGNDITYTGLHKWLRTNLPKSDLCQICNRVPPYDVANVTGIYNRDFKNWKRICRRCHMQSDGRMKNLRGQISRV